MRHLSTSLVFSCLVGLAFTATGCASSDYEDLQRRYQLLELENGNLAHDRDSLKQDLKTAKGDQAVLEDKTANIRQALEAQQRNNQSLREELERVQAHATELEGREAKVRELVSSQTVPDKQLRAALLQVLGPAQAGEGGLPPVTLPQVPAAAATPAAPAAHH